ncbi:MAG: ABC transporter ATP-binding protein [Candidatus Kerfeldbacteria bacterium]|nr:ABC transporter ATP-binding protein [Candidatus Kerfeldbacteria bacterium]
MKPVTRDTFRLYYRHSMVHRRLLWLVLTGVIGGIALSTVVPYFYKLFFDTLAKSGGQTAVGHELTRIIVIVLALHGVEWIFWRAATFAVNRFQPKVMADLSNTSFEYLHGHSVNFFLNRFVGSIVRRVGRMVRSFENISDRLFFNLLPLVVRMVIIVGVLVIWRPMIGGIVAVWIVIYLAASYYFALYKLRFDVKASAVDSQATGYLADTITNNTNVKLFTAQQMELAGYKDLTAKQRRLHTFAWDLAAYMEAFQGGFMVLLEFVVFYVGIQLWQVGTFSVGDFVLVQTYLIQLMTNLWEVSRTVQRVYQDLAEAEEMVEILNTPHEVVDRPNAQGLTVSQGRITFNDVTFAYRQTREIIQNFSLDVKPGEKVGLVGPSGAGKTTIVGLLFRYFDVTSGQILIDGQNIAAVAQNSLRGQMAFVSQDPILFHRTIMENIRYGRPAATDDEVIAAAKTAHCDEFVQHFPDQYRTYVGERGVRLSGGERQRVAIARAILKNAPILVLDEATSSLDSHVEALIQDALAKLMMGKTAVVIAHRLSTVNKMDRIIVVENGRIAESGTHAALLAQAGGLYKKLWELQAGGFIS